MYCFNGFNWYIIKFWSVGVTQTDQIFNCIVIPFQIQIARFIISDYDHNTHVFWYGLARIFMHTKMPPDYYVLFINCHLMIFCGWFGWVWHIIHVMDVLMDLVSIGHSNESLCMIWGLDNYCDGDWIIRKGCW